MSRRHYNLPPLTTLSAFEAAARHLSFKEAASELSVTPGAVSHQIKALEGELGAALFVRKHRGVELTEDGQDLFEALSASFRQISKVLEKIRSNDSENHVTVGSTTAVAALWLSPSVIRFWQDYPHVKVNQMAQDKAFTDRPDIDLFIRYGRDANAQLTHTKLYRDILTPVCSPQMAADLKGASLEDLVQRRLIHLETQDSTWTTWSSWFHDLGFSGVVPVGSRVNSYALALQVARKGAGLALGWKRLVQPMLASGKLVALEEFSLPAPDNFYLVGRPDDQLSEGALALKNWLLNELSQGSV
ncbi:MULTISPECIES: LysR substrate-binding domain-containing protein [unclassified Ruegeria]|uniref:LysR substrate-binding domain-containing protein n=1 Tax=unclassified Ruegeria TaxID=2625375 RepID=UPI001AE300FE|nr:MULTISPECIES: LysR substrate-binding domain-containing protein [unclassified Ruegeria]